MTLQNKSKSLHIVDDVFYYMRMNLIFYNNETKTILDIVIKDARSNKLKRKLNAIDDKFKLKLAE